MFHAHVSNVCSKCFICFKHILHSSVFMFSYMCLESYGAWPGHQGIEHGESGASGQGHACPYLGSRVPSMRRERSGVAGKEPWAQRQGQGACARRDGQRWQAARAYRRTRLCEYPDASHALITANRATGHNIGESFIFFFGKINIGESETQDFSITA
jgi:hypothetical protein